MWLQLTLATVVVVAALAIPASSHARATFATCYSLTGLMADGTQTRLRSAASNVHPLGTRIRLVGRPFLRGMRRFVVRDTGGALGDGHLDLWHPSYIACVRWGRRSVTYRIG